MRRFLLATLLLGSLRTTFAVDASCYALVGAQSTATAKDAPITCPNGSPLDSCFMLCGLCTTPDLRMAMSSPVAEKFCSGNPVPSPDVVADIAVGIVTNVSAIHGYYWLDGGGTPCAMRIHVY